MRYCRYQAILSLMTRLLILPLALMSFNFLAGCATNSDKPLVEGMLEPGGTIYRETEREEFGTRTTVKVQALDF